MIKDRKSYRILVIEDNPGDLTIIEDLLMEQILDPGIVNAGSFEQASGILAGADNKFDAILLDLSLGDKGGQELITAMLRISSLCPIIILTGYTDIKFSIKSIGQGIFDYLLKDDLNGPMLYKSILYAIERKRSIAELKESEKRYSDLFYLSPQPMWLFDPETLKFVQVNNAAVKLYGYSEEEFMNMTLLDIEMPEEASVKQDSRKVDAGNEIYQRICRHCKKSKEIIEVEIYTTSIGIKDRSFRSVIAIDVTEKNQHEHNIIKAIIKTQEDERYEIGGELHDNVCQILATSQMNMEMLKDSVAAPRMNIFEQLGKHIRMAIDEIRSISHRLAPAFFDDTTLEEAFGMLFDNFNIGGKYKISLYFNDAVKNYPVPLEIQRNLYRILQEQLRNILNYSAAASIDVDVTIYNGKLKMRVADDGVGFNMNLVKKGIGLSNIKRRAELFYGNCEINSSPGEGCEILISIPMPELMN